MRRARTTTPPAAEPISVQFGPPGGGFFAFFLGPTRPAGGFDPVGLAVFPGGAVLDWPGGASFRPAKEAPHAGQWVRFLAAMRRLQPGQLKGGVIGESR